MSHRDRGLHDLRGALNGVILQLEVATLAADREDEAMLRRALSAARRAATEAVEQLDRLSPRPHDRGDE